MPRERPGLDWRRYTPTLGPRVGDRVFVRVRWGNAGVRLEPNYLRVFGTVLQVNGAGLCCVRWDASPLSAPARARAIASADGGDASGCCIDWRKLWSRRRRYFDR